MGLFQQFPYTNLHELNLDWLIREIKNMESHAVLSVNGETGNVVLYKSENVVFPEVESSTWRMVRVADGHTAGVMFQNGLMYVMFDNTAERVYTVDHPPTYPVTSVNGQTGAITLYQDAGVRFPDVSDGYMNVRREIDKDGTPAVVGVQVDKTKAQRMNGTNRYDIYDSQNQPPYPVTSVNGQTGAVILAIPFETPLNDSIWMATEASTDHTAGIGRETIDGTVELYMDTSSGQDAKAYIHFVSADEQYSFLKQILTTDDIPSSSGVVSLNGLTGVVTLYGDTMPIESGSAITVKDEIDDLFADLAIVENGNQATRAIGFHQYVAWKGDLYRATATIAIGDTLSTSTNLEALTEGGLNALIERHTAAPTPNTAILSIPAIADRNVIYKEGNHCKICVDFTVGNNPISAFTKLYDIPAGYRVINDLQVIGMYAQDVTNTAIEPGYFQFDDNTKSHIRFSRQLKANTRYIALLDWFAN